MFDWAATAPRPQLQPTLRPERKQKQERRRDQQRRQEPSPDPALRPLSRPSARPRPEPRATAQSPPRWDLIVANLFLHHFEGAPLAGLLAAAAARGDRFLACEPRRSRLALAASRLVGAIGANAVTREDAVLSVHAGFCGNEIAALWPSEAGWRIDERPAGWFSHCFVAERTTDGAGAA